MSQRHIRNFAIIAHIDHGKSTLADRLLELTGTVPKRQMREQILDSNPIERERGITIKLAPVRMKYKCPSLSIPSVNSPHSPISNLKFQMLNSDSEFILNLIDTPGHVDFTYEVSRSLVACEGAILLVDATQGVQAQTLANLNLAKQHRLKIIPVINKIDLPNARIEETSLELRELGFRDEEILRISAKTGQGVPELLDAIGDRIPSPQGNPSGQARALVFSSQYDAHKGVIVFVRVVDGAISFARHSLAKLSFLASGAEVVPVEIGYFIPKMTPSDSLQTGEVGYVATGLKDIRLAKVGDTVTAVSPETRDQSSKPDVAPLAGYKEPKPMVFLSLFPIQGSDIARAREAMERLRLSDNAFIFRPIASAALGHGFHCGFLGLLHAEVVQERLEREFGLSMLATSPSVEYHVDGKVIQSAAEFPDPSLIEEVREPVMRVTIYTPKAYVGTVMQLAQEKRGAFIDMKYFHGASTMQPWNNLPAGKAGETIGNNSQKQIKPDDANQHIMVEITYLIPLSEMIVDFFDRLKAATEGYASLDYAFFDYQPIRIIKVDILVNHELVDALSFLAVTEQAQRRGRDIVERLAEIIPRQQFSIPIQGAIGGQIIARADVKAFRKDVTQKLYGGDRTRKDKLLDKQKRGKAKMKEVGKVEIPQSAFFQVLKRE